MAVIDHPNLLQTTEQTHTGNTSWTTKATISSASFVAGETYLVLAWAQVNGSSANGQFGARLALGATPTVFTASEQIFEPAIANVHDAYQTAFVFTQGGSAEDLHFQIQTASSGNTVRADSITIYCIRISSLAAADYEYSASNPNLAHTTTFQSTSASVTITSASSEKWVVIAAYRVDVGSVANQIQHRINRDSGTETVPSSGFEAENTVETLCRVLVRPYTLSSGSHTFTLEARDATSAANTTTHGFIIALKLPAFTDADYNYTAGGVTATNGGSITVEYAALNPTPSVQQDFLVLAFGILDPNGANQFFGRIQFGGTTDPTGSDTNRNALTNDQTNDTAIPFMQMVMRNMAASAQDIDADFGDNSTGSATMTDRALVVIGTDFTPPPPPDEEFITPDPVSITLSPVAPAVTVDEVTVSPAPVSTTLSPVAPSVTVGAVSITPAPVAITITPVAPSVGSPPAVVSPAPVTITLSPVAPAVSVGSVSVSPASVSTTLTPVAPSVTLGAATVTPAPVGLTLSVAAPSVTVVRPPTYTTAMTRQQSFTTAMVTGQAVEATAMRTSESIPATAMVTAHEFDTAMVTEHGFDTALVTAREYATAMRAED